MLSQKMQNAFLLLQLLNVTIKIIETNAIRFGLLIVTNRHPIQFCLNSRHPYKRYTNVTSRKKNKKETIPGHELNGSSSATICYGDHFSKLNLSSVSRSEVD